MYLTFAASLRQDSVNKKLIHWINAYLQQKAITVNARHFSDYEVPLYHGDMEAASGLPTGAKRFVDDLQASSAVILATPEYNFSISGPLKNLIDWASRAQTNPFNHKPVLLLSASPSLVGGNRGLWHTRVPLEALQAYVYPDMFSLANAYEAWDETGQFKDSAISKRLAQLLDHYQAFVDRLK